MPDTVRWGVLSTANIGRKVVAPALVRSSNGRLVAVASRDSARAEACARELGAERAYGSYEALLDAPDIDAVYIPLPNSLHKDWTIRAAEAGKHVLCEKPLALNAEDCLEMERAAEKNGVKLMEAFMYRFHPRTEAAIRLVRDGAFGTPRLIRSVFTFKVSAPDNIRLQPDLGGGALMDVGCYCVNASRTLAGAEPSRAQAVARWGPSGVDLEMAGTLQFPNELVAQFHCALTLGRQEGLELVGEGGRLELPSAFLPGTDATELRRYPAGGGSSKESFGGADEYERMVEHFANCILQGRSPRYGAAEAVANMRTIAALYRSARHGGRPELVV